MESSSLPPALVEKFGREVLEAGQAEYENRRTEARYSGYLRSSRIASSPDAIYPKVGCQCRIQSPGTMYHNLGFDTLPLKSDTKQAIYASWQSRNPAEMWKSAPADSNIAIRMGGSSEVAVIDCDSSETFANAQNLLLGLGYELDDYPLVDTASKTEKHIYVRFCDTLPGAFRKLSAEFGEGEFRYGSGAYVVAPPSKVGGNQYYLRHGDFRQLPRIELEDIRELFGKPDDSTHDIQTTNDEHASIPRLAKILLSGAYPDSYGVRYSTRSEADQAIICSLINNDFGFDEILALFLDHPGTGKFQQLFTEKGYQSAASYLQGSYRRAVPFSSQTSPGRKRAQECLTWAQSRAWPGRTGSYDRAVYIAHATIAHKAGKMTYAASSRTLAELAGCSWVTAAKATKRLQIQGHVRLEQEAVAVFSLSNTYSLIPKKMQTLYTSSKDCVEVYKECTLHDAFRAFPGLGKSAGEIWGVLLEYKDLTVKNMAAITGRHVTTIRRNLKNMESIPDPATGEMIKMVVKQGKVWHRNGDVNLDHIAMCLDIYGRGEKQIRKHARERRDFKEKMERMKCKTDEK